MSTTSDGVSYDEPAAAQTRQIFNKAKESTENALHTHNNIEHIHVLNNALEEPPANSASP